MKKTTKILIWVWVIAILGMAYYYRDELRQSNRQHSQTKITTGFKAPASLTTAASPLATLESLKIKIKSDYTDIEKGAIGRWNAFLDEAERYAQKALSGKALTLQDDNELDCYSDDFGLFYYRNKHEIRYDIRKQIDEKMLILSNKLANR